MDNITKKIYDLLVETGIPRDRIISELQRILYDLENNIFYRLQLSINMFLLLKDIIWFNLEHIKNGGEIKGLSNLRFFGKEFPILMNCCINDDNIIKKENIEQLIIEIDRIIKQWNTDLIVVNLTSEFKEIWNFGGKNPSNILIYEFNERLSSYGYNQYYNIVDKNGTNFRKIQRDTILCQKENKIGEYSQYHILYNLLIKIKSTCKNALLEEKDIQVMFEENSNIKFN